MPHEPFLAWDGFEYRDVQHENGVDLELLRHNLTLTPEERIAQHYAWAEWVLKRQDAAKAASPKAGCEDVSSTASPTRLEG